MNNKHKTMAEKRRAEYVKSLKPEERDQFLLSLLSEDFSPLATRAFDTEKAKIDTVAPNVSHPDEPKVELYGFGADRNPSCVSRCGGDADDRCAQISYYHGQSFCTVDYNAQIGRGNYDIVVYINHYGQDHYGTDPDTAWTRFIRAPVTYHLFTTHPLYGAGSPGRANYFQSGNNQTYGDHFGALGVGVYEKGTHDPDIRNEVWWGLWYFNEGFGWGSEWLHCGHDYYFLFRDVQ